MSVEDYGKDVAGVQTLQRKQDELERDMTAIHTQLVVSGHWSSKGWLLPALDSCTVKLGGDRALQLCSM